MPLIFWLDPISIGPNVRLTLFYGVPLNDATLYEQLVDSLIYLTVTRLDIAYVHIISQLMVAPLDYTFYCCASYSSSWTSVFFLVISIVIYLL